MYRTAISDGPLQAHCRRVAGWATVFAHSRQCSTEDLQALEQAAMLHHHPAMLLQRESLDRLASDLRVELADSLQNGPFTAAALAILMPASPRAKELADILDWADRFDEEFELRSWDPVSTPVGGELQIVDPDVVRRAGRTLPVFPTVAQRAMRLLTRADVGFDAVEKIVGSDQVLAAELLSAANASVGGPRQPITTIPRAIAHIGVDSAMRVICAASVRPVFASRNLFDLWTHSIEAAHVAEELALVSNRVDPAEAFLAGLVHDIGRLAFSLLSCEYQARSQRLIAYGCPTALVELALTATTHEAIGAELLREWALPPPIVEAVRRHHDPTQTVGPLAAILYLTEFRTLSDEDLPSRLGLERAMNTLQISRELVVSHRSEARPADPPEWRGAPGHNRPATRRRLA